MFDPIDIEEFRRRAGIQPRDLEHSWGNASTVVSLRDLAQVDAIQLMSMSFLKRLLSNVVLAGGNHERVYEGCDIHVMVASPSVANIGQTFVERRKYTSILENLSGLASGFAGAGGVLNIGAFIALGKTKAGATAVALYLPPIAEMNGDSAWKWVDGIHRGWIGQQMGNSGPIVAIEGVKVPFPCDVQKWNRVRPVDAKPPIEDRFFNLKPDLFRNLKYVGIDG